MQHGRDHDNRSKLDRSRHNNTPPDPESEPSPEPTGAEAGSRPAPTRRAAEREAMRHQLERERGRFAAGEGGIEHDVRAPGVTREDLEQAARDADELIKE